MSSFDTKWGTLPQEISQKTNLYIICITQFLICFCILMTLQPPFVTISRDDDYSYPRPSIILILIVCIACVLSSALMNNSVNNLWNSFKQND